MSLDRLRHYCVDKWVVLILLLLVFFLPLVGHINALVYVCFFALCMFLGSILDNANSDALKKIVFAFLVAVVAVFAGARNFGVGFDTNIYVMTYFDEAKTIHSLEDFLTTKFFGDKGFLLLACVSRFFSDDPQSFLFFIALFICFFTFLAVAKVNKDGKSVGWFIFLFMWFFFLFHEY